MSQHTIQTIVSSQRQNKFVPTSGYLAQLLGARAEILTICDGGYWECVNNTSYINHCERIVDIKSGSTNVHFNVDMIFSRIVSAHRVVAGGRGREGHSLHMRPLLLTWNNFNPSMDEWVITSIKNLGWNHMSIPKLQWCSRWSLGMDK